MIFSGSSPGFSVSLGSSIRSDQQMRTNQRNRKLIWGIDIKSRSSYHRKRIICLYNSVRKVGGNEIRVSEPLASSIGFRTSYLCPINSPLLINSILLHHLSRFIQGYLSTHPILYTLSASSATYISYHSLTRKRRKETDKFDSKRRSIPSILYSLSYFSKHGSLWECIWRR